MGTYFGATAVDQLVQAQAEPERHLVNGPDGRCIGCGGVEPCRARVRLEAVFALYGRLPKRRPGVTMVGMRRTDRPDKRSWFEG